MTKDVIEILESTTPAVDQILVQKSKQTRAC